MQNETPRRSGRFHNKRSIDTVQQTEDKSTNESPTERRRRQLRIAQRQYRARKDTSISTLHVEVGSLRTVIGQLDNTISQFRVRATELGLDQLAPLIAEDLDKTVESVKSLTYFARSSGITRPSAGVFQSLTGAGSNSSTDIETSPTRDVAYTESLPNIYTPSIQLSLNTLYSASEYPLTQTLVTHPSPGDALLPFGCRLYRYSAELAYTLLLRANSMPPALVERVFSLNYLYFEHEQLITRFRNFLDGIDKGIVDLRKGRKEHLTRLAHSSSSTTNQAEPRPSALPCPLKMPPLADEDVDDVLAYLNFDGRFLDPYEVEQYLVAKGVEFGPDPNVAVLRRQRSCFSEDAFLPTGFAIELDSEVLDLDPVQERNPTTDYSGTIPPDGFWEAEKVLYEGLENGSGENMTSFPAFSRLQRARETFEEVNEDTVKVDVNVLLKELSALAVCCVRTPGYRVENVDTALNTAIV
ncbi:hypothetical protein M501DRAFT_1015306 [Patellaria atrata CBS 101060]|uniref:BZIP domain-containing protein n=1 Tax=Patellaria atrata CBS 101060 TaxID=1346257 RepID=A0A9P4VSU7_9PEZI|nr:hypothetical protein M501DRAFT_1015306 [Patellaria atrata CBS 101060]